MPTIDLKILFALLGALFLALATWRVFGTGRLVPQARAWLVVGVIFLLVAAWLWWNAVPRI